MHKLEYGVLPVQVDRRMIIVRLFSVFFRFLPKVPLKSGLSLSLDPFPYDSLVASPSSDVSLKDG